MLFRDDSPGKTPHFSSGVNSSFSSVLTTNTASSLAGSVFSILIKSVPITRHLGKVLSGAIRNDRPIMFAALIYLVGTSTGAPLSFTKNTTNFAGLVWLAFRPTT